MCVYYRCRIQRDRWGTADVVLELEDAISCDELRPFWVSWTENSGLIEVGRGSLVGVDRYGTSLRILMGSLLQ